MDHPAAILVCVFALVYIRFWWRLPKGVRWRIGIGGMTFVGGALVVEAISSAYVARYGMDNFGLILIRVWEEGMEMAGVAIFIDGLLRHAAQIMPGSRLDIRG